MPTSFAWCCNGTRGNTCIRVTFPFLHLTAIPAVCPSFLRSFWANWEEGPVKESMLLLEHLESTLCHQPSFCLCTPSLTTACFDWTFRGSLIHVAGSIQACHWSFDVGCWQGLLTTKVWHDMTMVQVSWELPILQDTYVSYGASFFADLPSHPVILGGTKSAAQNHVRHFFFCFELVVKMGCFSPIQWETENSVRRAVRLQDSGSMFDQFKQKVRQKLFERRQFWKNFW